MVLSRLLSHVHFTRERRGMQSFDFPSACNPCFPFSSRRPIVHFVLYAEYMTYKKVLGLAFFFNKMATFLRFSSHRRCRL